MEKTKYIRGSKWGSQRVQDGATRVGFAVQRVICSPPPEASYSILRATVVVAIGRLQNKSAVADRRLCRLISDVASTRRNCAASRFTDASSKETREKKRCGAYIGNTALRDILKIISIHGKRGAPAFTVPLSASRRGIWGTAKRGAPNERNSGAQSAAVQLAYPSGEKAG